MRHHTLICGIFPKDNAKAVLRLRQQTVDNRIPIQTAPVRQCLGRRTVQFRQFTRGIISHGGPRRPPLGTLVTPIVSAPLTNTALSDRSHFSDARNRRARAKSAAASDVCRRRSGLNHACGRLHLDGTPTHIPRRPISLHPLHQCRSLIHPPAQTRHIRAAQLIPPQPHRPLLHPRTQPGLISLRRTNQESPQQSQQRHQIPNQPQPLGLNQPGGRLPLTVAATHMPSRPPGRNRVLRRLTRFSPGRLRSQTTALPLPEHPKP